MVVAPGVPYCAICVHCKGRSSAQRFEILYVHLMFILTAGFLRKDHLLPTPKRSARGGAVGKK